MENTTITNERIIALTQHLDCEANELTEDYNDQIINLGDAQYLVVTDDEANDLWEEDLNNYIDDCIVPELPEQYQSYFDYEAWKRDARMDGRAHSLARWDGKEHEVEINGTTYYIYRV